MSTSNKSESSAANIIQDNVKVKSHLDGWRTVLKKRMIKSKATTPRKTHKVLSSSSPSDRNCNANDCEWSTYSESVNNFISLLNNKEANSDEDGVCDDKVKKRQIVRWRAHRKRMILQSKTYSSLEAHRRLQSSGLPREECTNEDIDYLSASAEAVLKPNDNSQSTNTNYLLLLQQKGLNRSIFSHCTTLDKTDNSEQQCNPHKENDKQTSNNSGFTDLISGILDIKF